MKRIIVLTMSCLGLSTGILLCTEPTFAYKNFTPIYSKSEEESPKFKSEPMGYIKPQVSLLSRCIKNTSYFTKNIAGPCIGGIFTSATASTITCLASSYMVNKAIGTIAKEDVTFILSCGTAALATFKLAQFGTSNIKKEKDRFGKNYFRGVTSVAATACAAATYYAVKGACDYYQNS